MRNTTINYIVFCFLVLTIFSCKEDEFLSYEPVGRYSVENFYQTEQQIENAVNGIYPTLRGLYNGALWQAVEMRSDNTTFIPNENDRGTVAIEEIDYFVLTASSPLHNNIYTPCYKGISNANYVINLIENVPFGNAEDKLAKEGEARFLRAFYYYILTQSFGDLVKVTEIINSEEDASRILESERSPRQEVIDEIIIPDLEFAISNLPQEWTGLNEGRATSYAAEMLMAKIYFSNADFQNALPHIDNILSAQAFELEQNYRNVFAPGNSSSMEIIFANQFSTTANQGAGWFLTWLPYQSGNNITEGLFASSGASKNIPTQDLINTYEEGDLRFNATIGFYDEDPTDPDNELIPYSKKFLFPPVINNGSDLNFPVFRYADLLLMRAEALLETQGGLPNEAFEIINRLRVRAGLPLYFPGNPNPELDISTPEALKIAIRKERRLELAFESHRFWDLMRYGEVQETMQAHGEEQKLIQDYLGPFPEAYQNIRIHLAIPFNEVSRFGYTQNQGWE